MKIQYRVFVAAVIVVATVCGGQLFRLQIIGRDDASQVARGNALRELRVLPARGSILDRNGTLLVHNEPTYSITLTPRYFDVAMTGLLAELLGVADSVVTRRLQDAREHHVYRPSRSFPDLSFEQFSRVQEEIYRLPGVGKEINQRRRYLTGTRAAHALGYIGEVSGPELDELREAGDEALYRQGDLVGRTGVEGSYEAFLRGTPGVTHRVVNVHGLEVGTYRNGQDDVPPKDIYDVYLSLDHGVQAYAESLFVNKRGAAVALDPTDGGIIALVSMPDFQPESFIGSLDSDSWAALITDPETPLYNRATMNLMPPGSTWKPFMALFALQEGLLGPEGAARQIFCPGYHPLGGGRVFRCLGQHGPQDVVQALQNSCNTFFFELAYRMNLVSFERYAHAFGFGVDAPTDLREQTAGLIPDSAYYDSRYESWGAGNTLNLGIGQGDMGVTPLQLARYAAAVANGGTLHAPYLVSHLVNAGTGDHIEPPDAPEPARIAIDTTYFSLVRQGMRLVMELGSGVAAQIPDIPSGGKTGTAQAPGGLPDHSVFIMFAPYDSPRIAVAVQCENAGQGAHCAAPLASLIAERYLKGTIPDSWSAQSRTAQVLNIASAPLEQP